MNESGVDYAVGGGCSTAQNFEIAKRTAMYVGADRGKGRGSRVRACETEHLVSRGDQFFDDGGADESRRAGNKNSHKEILRMWKSHYPLGIYYGKVVILYGYNN
jgi:hypothetical protein